MEGSDNCMCVDVDGGRACYCLPGYILDSLRICRGQYIGSVIMIGIGI